MDALNAAVKIYKLKSEEDLNLRLLEILSFTQEVKSAEVLENYKKIAAGEIQIAFVKLKVDIPANEKNELEKKMKNKFGEGTVFDYEVSSQFKNNMEIRVGDDILII